MHILLVCVAIILSGSLVHAAPATFEGLGVCFHPTAISADGSTIVGGNCASPTHAVRWTRTKGLVNLNEPPGATGSLATAVSADGSVVVGSFTHPEFEAFRWTEAGGMVGLGDLPGGLDNSGATGASADGSVVVGLAHSGISEVFRWAQADGMVGLFPVNHVTGVSADGAVIVGMSVETAGQEAFRWTQASGKVGLGDLPGGSFDSFAEAVSADGSVVVGQSRVDLNRLEPFRWTQADGMVSLGTLPDGGDSFAFDVSADGSVVVGGVYFCCPGSAEAFIWDATHGMRSLKAVLENEFGLDLTGWSLFELNDIAISDDGRTITGSGRNPSGQEEAWIVTLPGSSTGAQRYSVTDLGDLPGGADGSQAFALNENGEVVGIGRGVADSDYSDSSIRPFLWTPSNGMQQIGVSPLPTAFSGRAAGINTNKQVVGCLTYSPDGTIVRPFLWSAANGMQLIDHPGSGCAAAINASGQVVGTLANSAFRWTSTGGFDVLEIPRGLTSRAHAINSLGEVAGDIALGQRELVFWDMAGKMQRLDGLPSGISPTATGINDNGEIVGFVPGDPTFPLFSGEGTHGFFWSPTGNVQNLGELLPGIHQTTAQGINNSRQVVGTSNSRAFLWTAEDGMRDLNNLLDESSVGWELTIAYAINNSGQIVGQGIHNGVTRAFLLTPTSEPTLQPILSVTPDSLDFGTLPVGEDKDLDLTIQNTGDGTLEGSCTTVAPFSLPDGCSFTLSAEQSQEVRVRFSPTAADTFIGNVNFTSNGGNTSPTVTGSGMPVSAPAVTLSSTNLTFGDQAVSTPSAAQTVKLTNSGSTNLAIGILSLAGISPGDYALSNNTCGSVTLPPGAECIFDITFLPTATGIRTAVVNIPSNATGSPHTVGLTGTGIDNICLANINDPAFERAFPQIKQYLKRVFKIADVSEDVLRAITWGDFGGTPLWKILIFAILVDDFLRQADRPIDKIDHEAILVDLADFTATWGFTSLLSRVGLGGVAAWASLGVLPITLSLDRFFRDVKNIALTNQIKLYQHARNAGCSRESIRNRLDDCAGATLSFTDDGWLNAVAPTGQKTLRCGFLQACYPRPLTPSEVYEYAEELWLRPLSEIKADYVNDKAQIGRVLKERITQCSR